MPIVSAKKMVYDAFRLGYAIPQFNVNNLEWAQTILKTCQKHRSPVILGFSLGAIKYIGGYLTTNQMVRSLVKDLKITIPVAIHLDHGDYQTVKKALAYNFTSVMFDGSGLSFSKNLALSKELVNLASKQDASFEAEVGKISGEEDGLIVKKGEIANPQECQKMQQLAIDFLAAGIGNVHGQYPPSWKSLDFKTLLAIKNATHEKLPLVLHGGSGIPDEQVRKAINLGVAKVNVNTELQIVYAKALKKYFDQNQHTKNKGYDPRKINAYGMQACEKEILDKIKLFGSINKVQ